MMCYQCGKELQGVAIEVYGALYHPECRSEVVPLPATYGAVIATKQDVQTAQFQTTNEIMTKGVELENKIKDLLWKNKTKFGNYRG